MWKRLTWRHGGLAPDQLLQGAEVQLNVERDLD